VWCGSRPRALGGSRARDNDGALGSARREIVVVEGSRRWERGCGPDGGVTVGALLAGAVVMVGRLDPTRSSRQRGPRKVREGGSVVASVDGSSKVSGVVPARKDGLGVVCDGGGGGVVWLVGWPW
jgi:hypothetical protein